MPPGHSDPRKVEKIHRYKPFLNGRIAPGVDDYAADYANILAMLFSMMGLMMKLKWCSWVALYCSSISFANYKVNDDKKQIFSSFMLSFSALAMCYIQDPRPMNLPGIPH
ncbi:hypothetical protein PGB90_002423 [Kerria lacca]